MQSHIPTAALATIALAVSGVVASQSFAAPITINSVATTSVQGAPSSFENVQGANGSQFGASRIYDINYAGNSDRVTSVVADGTVFTTNNTADSVKLRRSGTLDNVIIWQTGDGNKNSPTLNLSGSPTDNAESILKTGSLNVGVDNIFANVSDTNQNLSNVERVDFIFNRGIVANDMLAFAVFDRGNSNQHDGFQVVGITGLDADGVPNQFGIIQSVRTGRWGQTELTEKENSIVLRAKEDSSAAGYRPAVNVMQTQGGALVRTSELANAGQVIFGYALFAADVTGGASELADWTNQTIYPHTTSGLNGSRDGGGLDLNAASSFLYVGQNIANVPEPTALAALALGGMLLGRRSRRRTV